MLRWALIFLVIAAICGLLPGLGVVSGVAAQIAWVLFVVFLVLLVVSAITGRRAKL